MFKKIKKALPRSLLFYVIVVLVLLNLAPIMAPILAHVGADRPARGIYLVYSLFCHQFHWRSLYLFDHQCAWCSRDMFIWGAILLVAIVVYKRRVNGLRWYWMIPLVIPIAMDGGLQTVATVFGYSNESPLYISNNFMRMLSGSIFGLALGFWLIPILKDNEIFNYDKSKKTESTWKWFFIIFLVLFAIFITFIQLWHATSKENLPSNNFDSDVKTPSDSNDWFVRRFHAV